MRWLLYHGKRVLRITAGVVIVLAGAFLALPGIPGPGLVVVFVGLSILAVDFVWAHRLKTRIQDTAKNAAAKLRRRE